MNVEPGSAYGHGLLMQHEEEGIRNTKTKLPSNYICTGGKGGGKPHNQLFSSPIISLSISSLI